MKPTERTCREEGWILSSEIPDGPLCPMAGALQTLYSQTFDALLADVTENAALRFFNTDSFEFSSASSWSKLLREQGLEKFEDNLAIPAGISGEVRCAILALRRLVRKRNGRRISTGGCRAFWSREEYKGFLAGQDVGEPAFVLLHDGGCLAPYFNWDYCDYASVEHARKLLEQYGFWSEGIDSVTTKVYPLPTK